MEPVSVGRTWRWANLPHLVALSSMLPLVWKCARRHVPHTAKSVVPCAQQTLQNLPNPLNIQALAVHLSRPHVWQSWPKSALSMGTTCGNGMTDTRPRRQRSRRHSSNRWRELWVIRFSVYVSTVNCHTVFLCLLCIILYLLFCPPRSPLHCDNSHSSCFRQILGSQAS